MMKTLESFIAENPGLTSREIAQGLSGAPCSGRTVQRSVIKLYGIGVLRREKHGEPGLYRYYVANVSSHEPLAEPATDDGILKLVGIAEGLMVKGLYRRAAKVWLEVFTTARVKDLRERALRCRIDCQRKARLEITGVNYCPPGIFVGGEIR
ncbi:PerC family transcriptional regulator [Enterobacter sp. JMULE2]|uniref:PerC family transcriptional regulator n=1 Tax=Enterobacter sp. JMULE2 TaxID=2518340 RepID=UPI0015755B1F|nr:PerC family transcriptional regulator [Enterobacter sp. JMULE2]NTZ40011.1 PerC family transcriptional regulator [Enterobacter sp. JMULE2]